MTINIKKADNGAVVDYVGDSYSVYKFNVHNPVELAHMLTDIAEFLAGHDRHRAIMAKGRLVHGDKYECPDDSICNVCEVS